MMKTKSLRDSLVAIGEIMFSIDLFLYDIFGLNYKYNAFVCNIIKQANAVSLEEFHSRLLVLERGLTQQDKNE